MNDTQHFLLSIWRGKLGAEKGWDFSGPQDTVFCEIGTVAEQNVKEDSATLWGWEKFIKNRMLVHFQEKICVILKWETVVALKYDSIITTHLILKIAFSIVISFSKHLKLEYVMQK